MRVCKNRIYSIGIEMDISFFEILNFSRFPEPDADENSELLVLFLVLLWITTVLNLFLFFGPSERLWYRMNDVNKSKKI